MTKKEPLFKEKEPKPLKGQFLSVNDGLKNKSGRHVGSEALTKYC
jgi:hypothetical protein